jgi:hypothetical protein
MSLLRKLAIFTAAVVLAVPMLRADTLWIGIGKTSIKVDNVKVVQATGDKLQYVTDGGMTAGKQFSQLSQINIEGETAFNSAENAYADKDLDAAITNYQSVLKSSSAKDWMQARAASRLLAAGKADNRFDAQVDAYLALMQKDPTAAAQNKPTEPTDHTANLDAALASIAKGMDNPKLDSSQKSALLGLQLQINQAKGDNAQVNATLQQLVAMGGGTDADKARLKVLSAEVAYHAKQYDQAINDIDQNRALFTEPDQQVDALFILAQAKDAANGDKTDPDVLKDLAIGYMRVVTFGSQLPDRPHVAESLYGAAQIEEKLKEPQAAGALYKQLTTDRAYANSPVVPLAKAAMEKLPAK